MNKPKIIAFYLPQYHPTPHNDEWWGKGFTEWTNVARAKPLFRGHEQPHVPGELGFYDLRLPETREAQANLAKEYGIYGFCYYYYRFEKGKYELELPLNEVLKTGKPDFPFMICWANEDWNKKFWKYDGSCEKQILAEQKYGDEQDCIDFFYEVLPMFQDKRYIRIDGKPAFMIYRPEAVPDLEKFITKWQKLAIDAGLNGIYFMAYILDGYSVEPFIPKNRIDSLRHYLSSKCNSTERKIYLLERGIDSLLVNRQYTYFFKLSVVRKILQKIKRKIIRTPRIVEYKNIIDSMQDMEDSEERLCPVVVPNWDHTPRSKNGGIVFINSTPDLYKTHLQRALQLIKNKKEEHQIIFLRAWNEWGEGNYIEPDLKWGRKYLEATKEALNSYSKN